MAIRVAQIDKNDFQKVVEVHNNAFQGFFLTELGSEFLKLYYKSVSDSDSGILVGAYNDGELIGFCAACCKSAGYNSNLIKHNIIRYSFAGIRILFSRPKSLVRLLKNITKTGNDEDLGEYAEILSIAVRKDAQNSGAGKQMIENVENILKDKGIKDLSLTTDKIDNEKTLGFYRRNGFEKMYEFESYPHRSMFRLIKHL